MLSHVKMARRSFIIKKMYDTEMYALGNSLKNPALIRLHLQYEANSECSNCNVGKAADVWKAKHTTANSQPRTQTCRAGNH